MSAEEAKVQAEDWLRTQAALHNPDQVAGGRVTNVGGYYTREQMLFVINIQIYLDPKPEI